MRAPKCRCFPSWNRSLSWFWTGGRKSWSKCKMCYINFELNFCTLNIKHALFFPAACGRTFCSFPEARSPRVLASGGSICMACAEISVTWIMVCSWVSELSSYWQVLIYRREFWIWRLHFFTSKVCGDSNSWGVQCSSGNYCSIFAGHDPKRCVLVKVVANYSPLSQLD